MEDSYVRCHVILQITKVLWPQKDCPVLHLKGESCFLQVCLLGQLQQTELFPPMFPIDVNSTLTFDRIFTNCKVPSLLPEVLRGEHMKIELIQVKEDCSSGKVLGRYETRSDTFLYSETTGCGPFQLMMEKSQHYDTPPLLQISCCMNLLEAIVRSPIKVISQPFSSNRVNQINNDSTQIESSFQQQQQQKGTTTQSKQQKSSDYSTQWKELSSIHQTAMNRSHDQYRSHDSKSHDQYKSHDHSVHWNDQSLQDQMGGVKSHDQSHPPYHLIGESPSIELLQRSNLLDRLRKPYDSSNDRSLKSNKSHDTSHDSSVMYSDHSWEDCPRRHHTTCKKTSNSINPPITTKPFVVPHPDHTLLSKRDFCSSSLHKSKTTPTHSTPLSSYIRQPSFLTTPGAREERDELFAKYLPPSLKEGSGAMNRSRLVQEKLNDLMKDLHGEKKDSFCLNEDKDDTQNLRTSFARERDESLLNSTLYTPHNDSLLTRIASHDYWSTKAAQYTGKPHRLIFDETLEKIYGRLYRNS